MLITPAVLKKLINPYTVTQWLKKIVQFNKKGNCQKNLTAEFFVQLQKQVSAKNCIFFAMGGMGGNNRKRDVKDRENGGEILWRVGFK